MFSDDYSDIIETPAQDIKPNGVSSINDMLKMAGTLFEKVKDNKTSLETLDKEYRDFRLTYPVVYRLMVDHKEYSRKAFKLYLEHLAARNARNGMYWKNAKDFAESQSLYLINIFKTRKCTAKQTLKYKQEIQKTIQEEWMNLERKMKQLEEINEQSYYVMKLRDELQRLSQLEPDQIERMRTPNWEAALGLAPPDCV